MNEVEYLYVKLSLSVIGHKWLSSAMCEIGVEVGCNFVEVDDIFGPVSGTIRVCGCHAVPFSCSPTSIVVITYAK